MKYFCTIFIVNKLNSRLSLFIITKKILKKLKDYKKNHIYLDSSKY
ncbi:hypothetical protein L323_04315 [Ruminiclostridium papyrosolvens C7]|uniref:Uncharacterized protein n=1 Tax=Ruminiclostridium papyrosolvens C7 TaxID=1330534 RepID=U4R4Y8_9FIRM|nr:hypothetical protein L323_04315 [Ruminiclostridium papyrosolvens C7]